MVFSLSGMNSADQKASLRRQALARRGLVTAAEAQAFAQRLAEIGMGLAAETKAALVAAYRPIRDEASPLLLLERLAEAGVATALPVVGEPDQPLIFRLWKTGEPLIAGRMGIEEPVVSAPEGLPDLIFMPLAAYDQTGHRLGYGAGFYDRTLARLRGMKAITAVGIGFSVQELPAIPFEAHDEPLDYIVTERAVIACAKGS